MTICTINCSDVFFQKLTLWFLVNANCSVRRPTGTLWCGRRREAERPAWLLPATRCCCFSAPGLPCLAKGHWDEAYLGWDTGTYKVLILRLRHRDDKESHKLALSLLSMETASGILYMEAKIWFFSSSSRKSKHSLGAALSFVVQALHRDVEEDSLIYSSSTEKKDISKIQQFQTHQEVDVCIIEFFKQHYLMRTIFFQQMTWTTLQFSHSELLPFGRLATTICTESSWNVPVTPLIWHTFCTSTQT